MHNKEIKWLFLTTVFFMFTSFVNAETLTYNICSTCEYAHLDDVLNSVNSINSLDDKDIIINFETDDTFIHQKELGRENNRANSITINGNGYNLTNTDQLLFEIFAQKIEINNLNVLPIFDNEGLDFFEHILPKNQSKVFLIVLNSTELSTINNSKMYYVSSTHSKLILNSSVINVLYSENLTSNNSDIGFVFQETEISKIYNLNNTSINNFIGKMGNSVLKVIINANLTVKNCLFKEDLCFYGTSANIYNSNINKVFNMAETENENTLNIFNSKMNGITYSNLNNEEQIGNVFDNNFSINDSNTWPKDIIDYNANTYIHYDDTIILKSGEKIDLKEKFGFSNNNLWSLEDNIAEINGNILTATKEGRTKLILLADENHFLYNINLVVEKETLPEKIDKMTIKVPITGSVVKEWVIGLIVLIVGVIGMCSYMLIRRKK